MPVPDTTRQGHHPVVEGQGFIAVDLGDAAQAFGPADGVFRLHAAADVGVVLGALRIGQRRSRYLFAAPGLAVRLAVGQALRGHVVVPDRAQAPQIGQPSEQVQIGPD